MRAGHRRILCFDDLVVVNLIVAVVIIFGPFPERHTVIVELRMPDDELTLSQQAHHVPLEADQRLGLVIGADLVKRDRVRRGPEAFAGDRADVFAAAVAREPLTNGVDELSQGFWLPRHAMAILPGPPLSLSDTAGSNPREFPYGLLIITMI